MLSVGETDPRTLLEQAIERAANALLEGRLPAAWAGEQLVALIRHWGYLGYDWEMPDAFSQFDLVMTDLGCFPDGLTTKDEHIIAAAREVLATVRPV